MHHLYESLSQKLKGYWTDHEGKESLLSINEILIKTKILYLISIFLKFIFIELCEKHYFLRKAWSLKCTQCSNLNTITWDCNSCVIYLRCQVIVVAVKTQLKLRLSQSFEHFFLHQFSQETFCILTQFSFKFFYLNNQH